MESLAARAVQSRGSLGRVRESQCSPRQQEQLGGEPSRQPSPPSGVVSLDACLGISGATRKRNQVILGGSHCDLLTGALVSPVFVLIAPERGVLVYGQRLLTKRHSSSSTIFATFLLLTKRHRWYAGAGMDKSELSKYFSRLGKKGAKVATERMTPEERRERAKKAGQASGAARREKKK